ncbi:MAG: PLP-dependent aminotransferase family protein, partial [Longimicrobiales bacterium]
FPTLAWSRLLSRNAKRAAGELLAYGDPNGYRHLRNAVLEHISAARGVRAHIEQVFLVRGAQQAIDLIARVLLTPGDAVWIEDPGYLATRAILDANGLKLRAVPVDQDGLIVEEGIRREPKASAVFATPSNHFPLGATLSLARRLQLLEWAQQQGAWVIEDDYDSEFRYTGRPLLCMQGLDRTGNVLYVGTFSKTMFPALRLGYLVVPAQLVQLFERARDRFDALSPNVEQAALADFIVRGEYARHVRRMRELYRDRQACLVTEAQSALSDWLHLAPVEVGMQMVAWLRSNLREARIVQAATEVGVEVRPLSLYSVEQRLPPGLVLGFAAYPEAGIRAAVLRLASALSATG